MNTEDTTTSTPDVMQVDGIEVERDEYVAWCRDDPDGRGLTEFVAIQWVLEGEEHDDVQMGQVETAMDGSHWVTEVSLLKEGGFSGSMFVQVTEEEAAVAREWERQAGLLNEPENDLPPFTESEWEALEAEWEAEQRQIEAEHGAEFRREQERAERRSQHL